MEIQENNKPSFNILFKKYILVVLIVIISLIAAGIYYYQTQIEEWISKINQVYESPRNNEQYPSVKEVGHDTTKPEVSKVLNITAPELQVHSATEPKKDNIEPSERTKSSQLSNEELNNYRQYLRASSHLLINFSKNVEYSNEISKIKKINLPKEINYIVSLLEEYNNKFLREQHQNKQRIFPTNYQFIEKFIKIEKATDIEKEQMVSKEKIYNHIEELIDFLYSEKLQREFLNKG